MINSVTVNGIKIGLGDVLFGRDWLSVTEANKSFSGRNIVED